MKRLRRFYKKVTRRSTSPSDPSSTERAETTAAGVLAGSASQPSSPPYRTLLVGSASQPNSPPYRTLLVSSTSQPSSSSYPLPLLARVALRSISRTVAFQPTNADIEREPPSNFSVTVQGGPENIEVTTGELSQPLPNFNLPALSGETLPSTSPQPRLLLQAADGGQFPASEYTNMDAPRGMLGSNPMGQPKVGFFENATGFALNNPVMQSIQITQTSNGAILKDMREYTIPGAQYDSSARDSPPRCHPGTRTQILGDAQARIHNPDLETRMVWIYGPAGVGKSAIMQTLAEAEASRGAIFTTLFFSRPNERDDPKKAFTTLAYSLAVHNLQYQSYIGQRLADNPMFLEKTLDEQFQHLFVTPFLTPFTKNHINFDSQPWVIFLDGLDECHGEAEQCRIVELIRNSMLHRAMSTPFIWIIASRPEAHLKTEFTKAETDVGGFWKLEVPIDSDDSLRDVERYLHAQFSNMRASHSDSIPPLWPSESDFLKVAEASSGLFIFSSTLIAYLLGGDPVSRFRHVVSLITAARTQTVNPKRNPFRILDLLYTQIVSDVPEEVLSTTKLLLGFYLLPASLRLQESSLVSASHILDLEQYEVYAALRKLYSVLDCPPPQEAANRSVRFLHASFSDFLLDASRSQTYFIDLNEQANRVWQNCTNILHQCEIHHTHTCVNISWLPHGADPAVLQEDVWQDAQDIWARVLPNYRKRTGQDWPLIDNASLVEALRGLGPTIFRRTQGRTSAAVPLFDWLSNDAPLEVERNFLLETFPLRELDTDKLFKSLCAQRWCYRLTGMRYVGRFDFHDVNLRSLARFNTSEWIQARNALWNESGVFKIMIQESNRSTRSRVLGFRGTRQCVVIGPLDDADQEWVTYFILPYFDEDSG